MASKNIDETESKDSEPEVKKRSFGNCTVCLEDMVQGEHRRFLPCSHSFHELCIRPWLKTNTVCPVCKISIYVRVDEKDPEKIPEEFKNPKDSRTMAEVLRESEEQQRILDTIQGRDPGLLDILGGGGGGMDRMMEMMLVRDLISQMRHHVEEAAVGDGAGNGAAPEDGDVNPAAPPPAASVPPPVAPALHHFPYPHFHTADGINLVAQGRHGIGGLMQILDIIENLPVNNNAPLSEHDNNPGEHSDDELPPLEDPEDPGDTPVAPESR